MPRTRTSSDRAVSLLLKAIRQLPEREQDVVIRHLVAAGLGGQSVEPGPPPNMPFQVVSPGPGPWGPVREGLETEPRGSQFVPGGAQVVPVRLPEAQYRRLKDWCQGHNFAMAVVIRGLVDQFLDRQGAGPAGQQQTQEA
jgi:hypothetical protein